jgi:hypothetical protein
MTSVMLARYPETFAAGAIIAGLLYSAASNAKQALKSVATRDLSLGILAGAIAELERNHELVDRYVGIRKDFLGLLVLQVMNDKVLRGFVANVVGAFNYCDH